MGVNVLRYYESDVKLTIDMGPLKDAILTKVPWLTQELGFQITAHGDGPKNMGSSFVELQSDRLKLRFERDRGPITLEVAALDRPEQWFWLNQLWVALQGVPPEPELEGWALFFRENRPAIEQSLGPNFEETKRAIAHLRDPRASTTGLQMPKLSPLNLLRRIIAGPLGWVIAAILLGWIMSR